MVILFVITSVAGYCFFFYLTNRCICRCGSLCPVTTSCGGADGDGGGGGGDGGRGDGDGGGDGGDR